MPTGCVHFGDDAEKKSKGNRIRRSDVGYEIYDEQEETMEFTLNDHVRFRTNKKGDIRTVQGFELEEGQKYEVVYSPYEEGSEVEIITKVE